MLAVIIARAVVLDMGIAVMVVNDRKQQAVHPCTKIFIPEPTRLLLFSVQVREQQIERHIFKSDEATESVLRDLMYRTVDSALVSRHIQILYLRAGDQVNHQLNPVNLWKLKSRASIQSIPFDTRIDCFNSTWMLSTLTIG
jgi:hypothetical protein